MSKRDEYLQKMHTALDELQVKASLAKLETREIRHEVMTKYEQLRDKLRHLADAADDRWESLKDGVDAAWKAFRTHYKDALDKHRNEP